MPASVFRSAIALLCLLLITCRQAQAAPDYVIVEHINHLVVYNKYQQESTAQDLHTLRPFAPIRILKPDDLFGDGFTRCMQVEIDGEIFYLLKGKNGTLSNSGPLGFEQTFSNTTTLLDTIEILRGQSIRLSPINATPRFLLPGQQVVRIFQHRSATYCRTLSSPAAYGWINFSATREGRDWSTLRQFTSASEAIPRAIVQKVQARLDEANSVLARLFAYFNSESLQHKEPPRWKVESSSKAIACTLGGTATPEQFQQSTDYIVKDIENIVLGAHLKVTHAPGRIDIEVP